VIDDGDMGEIKEMAVSIVAERYYEIDEAEKW
jgi:hypothetical protein